jgi:epoxyqueuosine reductase
VNTVGSNEREPIIALALEVGFASAGLATLAPSLRAAAHRAWIAAGRHGTMDYLARSLADRIHPQQRFPWARTVLMLTASYEPPDGPPPRTPGGPLSARIAAYARGRDYHKVLLQRAQRLGRLLAERDPGLQWRAYTDTGPLAERELAAAAGLGWIGKHTLLIDPQRGSYFLLAALLLSCSIAPGEPLADGCAGCRACLDACPTGALVAPYELDARRCISYLTIEHRGDLEHYDPAGYLFGCDLCQLACPYNAQAADGDPQLAPRAQLDELALADVANLDEDHYQDIFRASAIKRATRAGLQRNAAILVHALDERTHHSAS